MGAVESSQEQKRFQSKDSILSTSNHSTNHLVQEKKKKQGRREKEAVSTKQTQQRRQPQQQEKEQEPFLPPKINTFVQSADCSSTAYVQKPLSSSSSQEAKKKEKQEEKQELQKQQAEAEEDVTTRQPKKSKKVAVIIPTPERQEVVKLIACLLQRSFCLEKDLATLHFEATRSDSLCVACLKFSFLRNKPEKESENLFETRWCPSLTIENYFKRLAHLSKCSDTVLFLSLFWVCWLSNKTPDEFRVNEFTIHRLLLAFLILNAKYFDDHFMSNENYAKIGGLTLKEVNQLELAALSLVDWNLFVEPDEYQRFVLMLQTPTLHSKNCCCFVSSSSYDSTTTPVSQHRTHIPFFFVWRHVKEEWVVYSSRR